MDVANSRGKSSPYAPYMERDQNSPWKLVPNFIPRLHLFLFRWDFLGLRPLIGPSFTPHGSIMDFPLRQQALRFFDRVQNSATSKARQGLVWFDSSGLLCSQFTDITLSFSFSPAPHGPDSSTHIVLLSILIINPCSSDC